MVLVLAVWSANAATLRVGQCALQWLQQHGARAWHVLFIPVLLVLVLMVGKGTLKGMALQLDNVTATSKPVLNHAIPNGVMSLYFAWNAYKDSSDVGDERTGLRQHGFESPQQAAQILGASGLVDEAAIARWLVREGPGQPRGQHLVFVQMESWSAEPFKYQSKDMDVLAGLNAKLHNAWVKKSLAALLLKAFAEECNEGSKRDEHCPENPVDQPVGLQHRWL